MIVSSIPDQVLKIVNGHKRRKTQYEFRTEPFIPKKNEK